MAHPARIRSDWRKRFRRGADLRQSRRTRVAGALLALSMLFFISVSRLAAASGGHGVQKPPGYLGIEFHDLTSEQATALHLRGPRGVEVLLVDHDGPAAEAGLQPHDLITGLNGHIVASGEALHRMIREAGAGVIVRLSVFRNGSPITIHAKLANQADVERKAWARVADAPPPSADDSVISGVVDGYAPSPPAAARAPHTQGFIGSILHGPFTGIEVEAMQPQLAIYFGCPKGQGLLVQSVAGGSPAASAGMHAGDVILRADAHPMRTTSDWSKHLHASKDKPMALDLLRDHHEITLILQLDSRRH